MKITLFSINDKIKELDIKQKEINRILQIDSKDLYEKIKSECKSKAIKIAIVSASNSLGFMDGGSDLGYMKSIPNIQEKIQNGIKRLNNLSKLGRPYLQIGSSMSFQLNENENIYFISSPTMFLPQKVINTSNPYYTFLSTIIMANFMGIDELYSPLFCTGYGGYDYYKSYSLMIQAIKDHNLIDMKNNYNFIQKNQYYYLILKKSIYNYILKQQPKIYTNTEFEVLSINDLINTNS
jgi:hypothetical protein